MVSADRQRFSVMFLLDMQRKAGNQATVRLLGKKAAPVAVDADDADDPVVTETAPEPAPVVAPAAKPGFWMRILRFLRQVLCGAGVEP